MVRISRVILAGRWLDLYLMILLLLSGEHPACGFAELGGLLLVAGLPWTRRGDRPVPDLCRVVQSACPNWGRQRAHCRSVFDSPAMGGMKQAVFGNPATGPARRRLPSAPGPRRWPSPLPPCSSWIQAVTGLWIYLAPFSLGSQGLEVMLHVAAGIASVMPYLWYQIRHWPVWHRQEGKGKRVIFPNYSDSQICLFQVPTDAVGPLTVKSGPELPPLSPRFPQLTAQAST